MAAELSVSCHVREELSGKDEPEMFQGGYCDVEFIESPPDSLQCPVCLSVMKQPHLLSCCGCHLCENCIENVKANGQACPCCRETEYNHFLDKNTRGRILGLRVRCNKDRCDWEGELGDLERHISNKCLYAEKVCHHGCGQLFPRHLLQTHQLDECPQRPLEVRVKSLQKQLTFKFELLQQQLLEQQQQLVQQKKELQQLLIEQEKKNEQHRKELQQQLIEQEKKHEEHMKELQQQLIEQEKKHEECKKELLIKQEKKHEEELQIKQEKKYEEYKKLQQQLIEQEKKQEEYKKLQKQLATATPLLPTVASNSPPYHIAMSNFTQHKTNGTTWYSPPFYSSPNGYKMQLRVDARGNLKGLGTHMSVYVYLLLGEHDSELSWPYRGSIVIKLINQKDTSGEHAANMVCFNDSSAKASGNGARPREGEKSKGWGYHQFLSHCKLGSDSEYIHDDTIYFNVSKITT